MSRETLLGTGLLVYGAIYTAGLLVASLAFHSRSAAVLALFCAGVTYLSYLVQLSWPDKQQLGVSLVAGSVASGVVAGLWLILSLARF